jgi:hypothetical protein
MTLVNSHTTKIRVEYTDREQLSLAVRAMGGKVLGMGSHQQYKGYDPTTGGRVDNKITGFGFELPGWRYPVVLDSAGELHYDDYSGSWGNVADLVRLKAEYTFAATERAAVELGWTTERTVQGLTVNHPQGGVLTVSKDGICETTGFQGAGCHEARETLGLKSDGPIVNKPEYGQMKQQCQLPG